MFDSGIKKVIKNGYRGYRRDNYRNLTREVISSEVETTRVDEIGSSQSLDDHIADFTLQNGQNVKIFDERLFNLIDSLADKIQESFLLSHFADLSDLEISELLDIGKNTPYRQRQKRWKYSKKI